MEDTALVRQERSPYQIMDALDDELIKAELENRIVDTWVYSFSGEGGKVQTGLSKVGVDACCTEMAKAGNVIKEGQIQFGKDPTDSEYILFQGMATRFVVDVQGNQVEMEAVNGTKRQWTKMKLKSGKIVDDPFWYEKGAMKALRNARARLIPEEIRTKIITLAKQKGKIKPISEEKAPDEKKPLTDGQRKRLWAITKSKDISDEEAGLFVEWLLKADDTETIEVDGKAKFTKQCIMKLFKDEDKLFNEKYDEFAKQYLT